MKFNEVERQKSERQNFRKQAKHTGLYSDLIRASTPSLPVGHDAASRRNVSHSQKGRDRGPDRNLIFVSVCQAPSSKE